MPTCGENWRNAKMPHNRPFFSIIRRPPRSTLLPSTTLFRSSCQRHTATIAAHTRARMEKFPPAAQNDGMSEDRTITPQNPSHPQPPNAATYRQSCTQAAAATDTRQPLPHTHGLEWRNFHLPHKMTECQKIAPSHPRTPVTHNHPTQQPTGNRAHKLQLPQTHGNHCRTHTGSNGEISTCRT